MSKKFKFNKGDSYPIKVKKLGIYYELSEECKSHILQLSRDSYSDGSNTAFNIINNK